MKYKLYFIFGIIILLSSCSSKDKIKYLNDNFETEFVINQKITINGNVGNYTGNTRKGIPHGAGIFKYELFPYSVDVSVSFHSVVIGTQIIVPAFGWEPGPVGAKGLIFLWAINPESIIVRFTRL